VLPPLVDGRALFIDESGKSDECVHLTALSILDSAVDRARALADDFFDRFTGFFKLPTDYELHGVDLVRKRGDPTDAKFLSLHRREFLYRDALEACADIESLRVYTVSWDWRPHARRIPNHGGGPIFRERETYERLFDWVGESGDSVTSVTIDGIENVTARRCYERYVKFKRRRGNFVFLPDTPALVSSTQDRLIQFADLVAYAEYHALQHRSVVEREQSAEEHSVGQTEAELEHNRWVAVLHDHYNQTIPHVAADGGWYFAMRTFTGETKPSRTHGSNS
jgi:hypothetical protein